MTWSTSIPRSASSSSTSRIDSANRRYERTPRTITSAGKQNPPGTVGNVYSLLATVMAVAVDDGLLPRTPCKNINLPTVTKARMAPLPVLAVEALIDAAPGYWRPAVVLAVGSGMRERDPRPDVVRVEFLHRRGWVDRQVQPPRGKGKPYLRPTKTPASDRAIPFGDVVLAALSEHVKAHPRR